MRAALVAGALRYADAARPPVGLRYLVAAGHAPERVVEQFAYPAVDVVDDASDGGEVLAAWSSAGQSS